MKLFLNNGQRLHVGNGNGAMLFKKGGGVVPFDPDYQAILDRATALGYTLPSAACQSLQNSFVVALKSAGAWTLLRSLNVWAHDSSDDRFGLIDWIAPTVIPVWSKVNTPLFIPKVGYSFLGTSRIEHPYNYNQIINTNFLDEYRNNFMIGSFIHTQGTTQTTAWGLSGGSILTLLRVLNLGAGGVTGNSRHTSAPSDVNIVNLTFQNIMNTRGLLASYRQWIDNTATTITRNSSSLSSTEKLLFAGERTSFSQNTQSMAYYGQHLNDTIAPLFSTAIKNYMNAVILL
jgi:hypothetical protein